MRRQAAGRNLLYALLVPICLIATWNLLASGLAFFVLIYLSYGSLVGALALSSDVPLGRPRPAIAAAIPVLAWSCGLLHLAFVARDSEDVATVVVVAFVGLLLPLFAGSRLRQFTKTRLWLGLTVTTAALGIGVLMLPNDGPPVPTVHGIGFTSQITTADEERRGLILRLNVYPDGCDGTEAEVQVFGTSEFWARHPPQPGPIPLQIFMPAGSARDAEVLAMTNSVIADHAVTPGSNEASSMPVYEQGEVLLSPANELSFDAGLSKVSTIGHTDLIDAWVSGNWSDVRAPVVFKFKPDWVIRDGIRSCYLQTPPLIGSRAWPEIASPAWKQIDHAHLVLPSVAWTSLYNVSDLGGQSRPEPTDADAEALVWKCGIEANDVDRLGTRSSIESHPLSEYEEPSLSDCAEVTRLELNGAKALSDLLIFIVGGLVSFGLTLAFSSRRSPRG